MTIYTRPKEIVFAESAKNGEVVDFPDIARGWGITFEETDSQPPMEWFNALTKQQFESVRYLMQRGVSEWSVTEDYPVNALVQFEKQFYVSLLANKGQNPKSSVENWISFDSKYAAKEHAHEQYVSRKDILSMFIGMPFSYPLSNAPEGWVSMDGAAINPAVHPKLASLYGGNLPDLRGEFIRGWDKGRGLDSGRNLLSLQADELRSQAGTFSITSYSWIADAIRGASGIFTRAGIGANNTGAHTGTGATGQNGTVSIKFGGEETRPKNIAYHYITPAG